MANHYCISNIKFVCRCRSSFDSLFSIRFNVVLQFPKVDLVFLSHLHWRSFYGTMVRIVVAVDDLRQYVNPSIGLMVSSLSTDMRFNGPLCIVSLVLVLG